MREGVNVLTRSHNRHEVKNVSDSVAVLTLSASANAFAPSSDILLGRASVEWSTPHSRICPEHGDMPANQIIVAHPQAMDEVSHAVQMLAQSGGLKRLVKYEE